MYMQDNINGALIDPRSDEQKSLDYTHEEVLGGAVSVGTVWTEGKPLTKLSLRRQITSSSCGGQASAKALEAFTGTITSATPTYHFRSNYPTPGMYQQEIGSILVHEHTTSETLSQSQNMTEAEMNAAVVPIDLPMTVGGYYTIPAGANIDMTVIATALQSGHALIIGINSNAIEWQTVPVVGIAPTDFSHFVCAFDTNYLLHNGEMSIGIEDSCNASTTLNGTGQRILTETFLKARCWGILALMPVTTTHPTKPVCAITTDLSYGLMQNPQVVNLQDMLKYDGCLSLSIPSTGNFLSATKQAVIRFQEKYATDILTPNGLTIGTGYVGASSIAKLHYLFS